MRDPRTPLCKTGAWQHHRPPPDGPDLCAVTRCRSPVLGRTACLSPGGGWASAPAVETDIIHAGSRLGVRSTAFVNGIPQRQRTRHHPRPVIAKPVRTLAVAIRIPRLFRSLSPGRGENGGFALPGAEEAKPQFPQPRHWRAEAFKRGPGMALRQGVGGGQFVQRSENARISVSPQRFPGTANRRRKTCVDDVGEGLAPPVTPDVRPTETGGASPAPTV